MSAKRRKQVVIVEVQEGRIAFLPAGLYSAYIDSVQIKEGSIVCRLRILNTIEVVEKGGKG